jgi:conjugative transfer signal peptidase TraF
MALVALALYVALGHRVGLWFNLSPSMPVGVYESRNDADPTALAPGTIVAVCLPEPLAQWGRRRGYLVRGRCSDGTAPIGKPIFAIAGDTVTVASSGLARNRLVARDTRPLAHDRHGLSLPRIPYGTYPVAVGQLWLVSTHTASSWDSRYFGPVSAADVIAVLRPIWVDGR